MRKIISLLLAAVTVAVTLGGCGRKNDGDGDTLKVAVLEAAYGSEMWKQIAGSFETISGIRVELVAEKNLEDVIGSKMKSGDYPDVVHLATGREAGLTETMIRENALEDITDVFSMTVPGENVTVSDKLISGFIDTLATNPYGNGKTYLAPMFYGPCGLFYDEGLFSEKGWKVPSTWDEMWKLGDAAKAEGIYLFTYPTAGYFDSLFFALLGEAGGTELFDKCMTYTDGIWESEAAGRAFDIVGKIAEYTDPTTVANAGTDNYLKNQQLVLDGKALFMPNGTWVVGEMADAPRRDGFKWGFTALPAIDSDRYSYTYFEQCWIPSGAKNKDAAKKFISYLYSDEAAKIFASAGAVQPIRGIADKLSDNNKLFYSIYDTGALPIMGTFAAAPPVEGVSMTDTLFSAINSIVSGDKTVDQWQRDVERASDAIRAARDAEK